MVSSPRVSGVNHGSGHESAGGGPPNVRPVRTSDCARSTGNQLVWTGKGPQEIPGRGCRGEAGTRVKSSGHHI